MMLPHVLLCKQDEGVSRNNTNFTICRLIETIVYKERPVVDDYENLNSGLQLFSTSPRPSALCPQLRRLCRDRRDLRCPTTCQCSPL